VIQGDARMIHLGKKYDLIISNPPFLRMILKALMHNAILLYTAMHEFA